MSFNYDPEKWQKLKVEFTDNQMDYIENALQCILGRGTLAELVNTIYEMGTPNEGSGFNVDAAAVRRALERYEHPSRVNEDYIRRHEWNIRGFREVGDKDEFEGLGLFTHYTFCNDVVNVITPLVLQAYQDYFVEFRNKSDLKEKCREWWVSEGGEIDDQTVKDNYYNLKLDLINHECRLDLEFEDDNYLKFKISDKSLQENLQTSQISQTSKAPINSEPLNCLYIRLSGEDVNLKNMEGKIKFGIYEKGIKKRFQPCLKEQFDLKIIKIFTFSNIKDENMLKSLKEAHDVIIQGTRTLKIKSPIKMIENIILLTLIKDYNLSSLGNTKEYFDLKHCKLIMEVVDKFATQFNLVEVDINYDEYKPTEDVMNFLRALM